MKKIQPHASPSASGNRSPFKDLTNTPIESNANTTSLQSDKKLSWYARLSDEKKAEYLQKRRVARQQTKAAKLSSFNSEHVSQSHDSSLPSVQCTPLSTVMNTDGTDTPASSLGTDHPAEQIIVGRKKRTGQGWYASLSEDKKEEYRKKQRQDRLHKKSEAHIVNMDLPQSSTIDHVSPVASYSPTISMSDEHKSQNGNAEQKKAVGEGWYARLSEHKKEEYLHKLRMSRLQKKTSTLGVNKDQPQPSNSQTLLGFMHVGTTQSIGTAQPDLSQVVDTPCTVPTRYDQNAIDWLHNNPTYQRRALVGKDICNKELTPTDMLEQESLKPTSYVSGRSLQMIDASSCKKRQRMRGQYAMMTPEQKDGVLHRNRAYKMVKRHTLSLHQQSGIAYVPAGSAYTSPSNPAIHVQPSRAHNPTDHRNSDGESDPACISEPFEQCGRFEDNVDTMQEEEETMHDDDEESRIFSGLGDVFDSYRVTTDVPQSKQNDDPYDFVYHNLPQKHHVLKPVNDCVHCGAMRLQYEGPAFCCRKGKVKIATPEVPQELRRLFTSQVDADAKYFRKHIRYFNTHFSFTRLGVTLDKTVSTAARTGVYTFLAQGAMYYKMDDLVPGGQGPRHLQLYFYDTDETLEHRVKRSPDLDINIIRKILEILEDNPYVQTFKSIGSVPNLEEYRISLNTDIRLDQRRYNAPTASQVAAMWVEGSDPQNTFDRQVVLYGKGDRPIFIRAYYGCYDPLAYPLFFPRGETGWNRWIPYETPPKVAQDDNDDDIEREDLQGLARSSNEHLEQNTHDVADDEEDLDDDATGGSRKFVSAREYYCFKLQVRKGLFNIILFGARGFQQWAVDMYIKMETMRLDFFSDPKNQKRIRADLYQGVVDVMDAGETRGCRVGKRIVLPRTFPGGDRDMQRRFLDAMAIVQRFGKPDYFITMTCNPHWEEITSRLEPGQTPQDRPDLVARVYRAKLRSMKDLLIKKILW